MRTARLLLISLAFAPALSAMALTTNPTPPDGDKHHVMWTAPNGKDKCCTKKDKAKADRCAEKMRAKGKAKNVKVMTGTCKSM